ncbi:MAG TPA: acylphosphatase [Candidatus Korarchaeota archaeon]|nr:acylphosphatase [Candidatus Korarchaeota archaeon]
MGEKVRAHVYISGIVQGVFFRANTKKVADRLGVKGWVRNLIDGRVEAVFEGDKEAVNKIIEWCKTGPPLARVDNVEVRWEHYKGEFEEFSIRYG